MTDNRDWLVPDWPVPANVRVVCTTRRGGVSRPPWDSMNPAAHVGDDPVAVTANRDIIRSALALPAEPAWLQQVHGTRVIEAGMVSGSVEADAAWTDRPGKVCVVMTADCLPVVLSNRTGTRVAVAHAGWRGLVAGVIEEAARLAGLSGSDACAWLGPAIGPDAFIVGDEVRQAFLAHNRQAGTAFRAAAGGRWHADLYRLARQRLDELDFGTVSGGNWCTRTDRQRFFSYRRDGQTGRMATLAWLEDTRTAPGRV